MLICGLLLLWSCGTKEEVNVEIKNDSVEEVKESGDEVKPEDIKVEPVSQEEPSEWEEGIVSSAWAWILKDYPIEYTYTEYNPSGEKITVSNKSELEWAISRSKAWDHIILEAGDYGDIVIYWKEVPENKNILIEWKWRQTIIEAIKINHSSGLVFRNITFGHSLREGEKDWSRSMAINKSSNISIINSYFESSDDKDHSNDITWIGTTFSDDLVFYKNNFSHLSKWIILDSTTNSIIANNMFTKINIDGVNVAWGSKNILVEANSMSEFYTCDIFDEENCKNHPDFIQVYNDTGKNNNENIRILSNTLMQETWNSVQSIFVQSNNSTYTNKNIKIENNLIYNTHLHWISIYNSEDISVKNNTVLQVENTAITKSSTPRVNFYSSKNITLTQNVLSTSYYSEKSEIKTQEKNSVIGTQKYGESLSFEKNWTLREDFYQK